jgi:hypothetical protein
VAVGTRAIGKGAMEPGKEGIGVDAWSDSVVDRPHTVSQSAREMNSE